MQGCRKLPASSRLSLQQCASAALAGPSSSSSSAASRRSFVSSAPLDKRAPTDVKYARTLVSESASTKAKSSSSSASVPRPRSSSWKTPEDQRALNDQVQLKRSAELREITATYTVTGPSPFSVDQHAAADTSSSSSLGADSASSSSLTPSTSRSVSPGAPRKVKSKKRPPMTNKAEWTKTMGFSDWRKLREKEKNIAPSHATAPSKVAFKKGSLVALEFSGESQLAVVLDTVLLQNLSLRLLLISGEIIYQPPSIVAYLFESHKLMPDQIANLGRHDSLHLTSPENHAARRDAISLIRDVARFEAEARSVVDTYMLSSWEDFRSKVADERRLVEDDNLLRWVMKKDAVDERVREVEEGEDVWRTADEWARRETILHYSMQRHLLERSDRWICESWKDAWRTTRWRARSTQEVDDMIRVRTLIESKDERLTTFIKQARQLIDANRPQLNAPPPETLAANPSLEPLLVLKDEDAPILRHIQASLSTSPRQPNPFSQSVPWILKRTERYGEVFDADCTARFLVEIGVRCDWDNWAALSSPLDIMKGEQRMKLPQVVPPKVKKAALSKAKSSKASKASSTPILGPDDLYPVDPLDTLRYDFGQLNVFVIDDPDAAELDDGVSIERCSDPNHVWIHVHIADPTTLLHPGHRLAAQGLARATTAYFPEGNYPLLPDELTLDRFSLGGKGGVVDPVKGQEALTFSAKIDVRSAEMVDYQVRAAIIRSVHVTSYQAVNEALDCKTTESIWPLGPPPSNHSPTKTRPFKDEWMQDIQLLRQVAGSIAARRFKAGSIGFSKAEFQTKVHPQPLPSLALSPTVTPHSSVGAPYVAYRVSPVGKAFSESQRIVQSCMTLAGNVAGRFFFDRNIPTAYRSTPPALARTKDSLEQLLERRNVTTGEVNMLEMDRLGVVFQAGQVSLRPQTHYGMGITDKEGGYVRVTSPLRRYGDIIAHWQIKHALLAEAASTSTSTSSTKKAKRAPSSNITSASHLLFSEVDVFRMARSLELTSRLVKDVSDRSNAFWAVYALQRHARQLSTLEASACNVEPPLHAYPFSRTPLPKTARLGPYESAFVVRTNVHPLLPRSRTVVVAVPELGLEHVEAHYPKGKVYALGEEVRVVVDEFYLGPRSRLVGTVLE